MTCNLVSSWCTDAGRQLVLALLARLLISNRDWLSLEELQLASAYLALPYAVAQATEKLAAGSC